MVRRRLLTDRERRCLFELPTDEVTIIANYTLSPDDIEVIGRRYGAPNRLGLASHIALMRHPGFGLSASNAVPVPILHYLAAQLHVDPTVLAAYGQRPQIRSLRDRAILALGLAAALRRSELVALEWRDVELVDKGLKLKLRHSKTDQDGEGQVIAVPSGETLKPVERLKAWLAVRGTGAGPLFYQLDPQGRLVESAMSDRSIARLIQKYAGRV